MRPHCLRSGIKLPLSVPSALALHNLSCPNLVANSHLSEHLVGEKASCLVCAYTLSVA